VDRRALVEWAAGGLAGRREAAKEHGEARTPVEAAVARVWCEVLGLASVGVEEDFFALGGHSLLAARVIARLRAELAVDVSLRSFFASPTVAGLAQHVTTTRATGETPGPSLVPAPRQGPLPASFAQERMWFIEQMTPGNPAYNISGAMLLEGTLDGDALVRTFSEIVRRHEVLRTTYAWQDGQLVQIVQPPRSLPLHHVDLSELADSEREDAARQVVLAEAATPLDLGQDLPLRVTLVHLGNGRRVVVLVMHHIASDGWSLEVVFREVAALYAAFVDGRPSPLPALPVQYADYALWQRQRLSEQALAAPLAYWHRQLADLAGLALPTDRPRPAVASLRGAMCECGIAQPCVDALNAFAREEGATLFMVLLAAFQTLLHRYTGQDDIAVGTPVAGRTEAATEPLIGLFVNSLVLRGDLSGNPSFRTLLRRTRESVLDADAHQAVPFEKLVETLQPQREPARHPLFQAFFVYNNISTSPIEMPELKLSTFEDNSGYQQTAKFDLELAAVHGPVGLRLVLNYSTDLFERNTVSQMLEHLQELLAFLSQQPDHNLLNVPLSGTRHQLQEVTVDDFADDDQFAFE
jgi:hypothetical protein